MFMQPINYDHANNYAYDYAEHDDHSAQTMLKDIVNSVM